MQNSQALLEQVKNYKPQAGEEVLKEFIGGNVHLDFQNELLARIENLRDSYETADSKTYIETKGAIRALREQAFDIFTDLLENRRQDSEEEENG